MPFQELTDEIMHLYAQGNYAGALELGEQNADFFPEHTGRTTFWKMCFLSLCGRAQDVISVFQSQIRTSIQYATFQNLSA
jgi:hypothetical protein